MADKKEKPKKKSDKSIDKSAEKGKDKKASKDKDDKKKSKEDNASKASLASVSEKKQSEASQQVKAPAPVLPLKSRQCLIHDQPLKYYCETSDELVCDQCTIQGPHNTQLHRITTLQDSFNRRAAKINYSIENNLIEKSKLLQAQLHRTEYRMEEIQYITSIIERDARVEYGGILERLNNAEGVKLSLLYYDIEQLQKLLNKINELGQKFFELTKEPANYIPFLREARNMWELCNQYIPKPIQTQINIYPYDLPRELQETRAQIKQIEANDVLLNLKDEIIWKLVKEGNDKNSFKSVQEFEEQISKEIQEWAKLAETQTEKLQKFQLICFFCQKTMEEKTVNKSCSENRYPYNPSYVGFTIQQPKIKYFGNKRHFFGKPLNQQQLEELKSQKQAEVPTQELLEIKINILQENFDIKQQLEENQDGKDFISSIKFSAIILKNLKIQVESLEKVIYWLDQSKQGRINWKYFLTTIDHIQLIENQ